MDGIFGSAVMDEEEMSGQLALLNTLNAQLIIHILETHGDSAELDFLQE